ncbi:MAG TPA: Mur ligase family protein [Candidatus Saccharimonadales bacterium]|nr:Mur ligase family protein [Candidatus Saccharimonadales bacterium]
MQLTTFAEARAELAKYWPSNATRTVYTLDYMRQLLDYLGNPQDSYPVIHVAGTSGKTSTSYYAAGLLQTAGKRVGLTVSPHVDEVNERVQINLTPLPEKEFCSELSQFLTLIKKSQIETTYFELLVAFAFWEFARQRVDYAVVEVGLGGLLDATNTINRADKVCVLTDIGMDHMSFLGNTLHEIAGQKAGIIQAQNTVFCYKQADEIAEVFMAAAQRRHADLHVLAKPPKSTAFGFLPLFQRRNIGLSLAAVQFVLKRDEQPALTLKQIEHAAHTYVPARMEQYRLPDGGTLVTDGAHNAQKLHVLTESLRAQFPGQKATTLVSFVAGREGRIDGGIAELVDISSHIIVTTYSGSQDMQHHSVEPAEIVAACKKHGFTSVEIVPDVKQALDALLARPESFKLITGSFYLLSHIRPHLASLQHVR